MTYGGAASYASHTQVSMEQKIALVTGGGKGIGAACCKALAAEGFKVAIHCNRSRGDAEALAAQLPGSVVLQANLSSTDELDRLAGELKNVEGDLSVLVNNAGVVLDAALFTASVEDLDTMLNTNLRGTWYLTKKLARMMMRKKQGRVINISSVIGHTGNVGQSGYGMTKAAIDNFTKSAAMELAPFGILVNSVAPGFIETDMTKELTPEIRAKILERIPLGRIGTPAEVAEIVAFLASRASYCTGTVFHVNGGMYAG